MTTLASRIAAYWPLDTTHGRSLPADYLDSLRLDGGTAPSATGKLRECLSLTSSLSQFRSRSHDAALSQPKGVCCWVKFTTLTADMTIISKGSDATDSNTSFKVWFDFSDLDLALTVGTGAASTTVNTSGLTLVADTWYFIRAYNDGSRMGIWVDEVLYGSTTAVTPLSESGILYLGRDFGGNYLDGLIDEVVVFNSSPTAADGHAFYDAGAGGTIPVPDHRVSSNGQPGLHDRFGPPTFAESDDGTAYLAQGHVPAQRISGTVARAGVPAPQTSVRPRGSGAGTMVGTVYAYSRWLDADGRVSNVSPISDATTLYGDATGTITGATNATPIVVTSASHGLLTGDRIQITGQSGNTAANGNWTITKADANSFQLDGSSGNGDWQASAAPSLAVTVIRDGMAGASAVQTVSFPTTPTAGTFTLSFRGATTAAIAYNATATDVEEALEILTTIGAGNVTCTGGPVNTTAVVVTFGLSLANEDLPLLESEYTGGSVTLAIAVVQGASSGTNEQQTLELLNTPTGGTFTLSFGGATTAAIAYNATAAAVQTALEALINIDVDDVACAGGDLPAAVTCTFKGQYEETDVSLMTANTDGLDYAKSAAVATTVSSAVTSDLSSGATYYNTLDVGTGGSETKPWGIHWKSDGTTGIVPKGTLGPSKAEEWSFSTPWDITTGTYVKQSSATFNARAMEVSDDGTKLYARDGLFLNQYPMSTAWDLSTLGAAEESVRIDGYDTNITGLCWANSGLRLYMAGVGNGKIYELVLSSAWDISTISSSNNIAITEEGTLEGVAVTADGLTMYVIGITAEEIFSYTLSTAWDVSTATYTTNSVDVSGQSTDPRNVILGGGNESRFYVIDKNNDSIDQWTIAGTNETQQVTMTGSPTSGTFTLTYSGQTTAAIDYDAAAAEVDTALEALSNIGAGDVTCTGGPLPGTGVDVEFTGSLASLDVALMTADSSGLTGVAISTVTPGVPPTAWDLSVGEYDSISRNVCPGENVVGVTFKPDGTQLYALVDDGANSYIQQYRLYSPWDLTTMQQQTSRNLVIGSITSSPADLYIESTGRYLLVLGGVIDTIYEFDSDGGTAWDIRDYEWVGAGSNDYDLTADDIVPLGVSIGRCFHIDEAENKLYAGFTDATAATSKIYQWSTSASHTMSGGGSYDSKVLDVTAAVTGVLLRTVFVRPESATIFVAGYSNDTVYEYDMSTPGDVSTGSKTSDELVLTHGESGGSGGITHAVRFRPDGKKVFAKALAGGQLYQYDISSGSSTNEVQRITTTGTPTEGTFTLTYEGETTSAIAHDASAATIDTALEALTNIGSGALTCTGGDLPGSAVDVEFSGTYVGGTDVTEMTVEDNGLFCRVATTATGGSGSNEAITITPSASIGSGTFTLTFDGETTDSLAYNSTAADVDSALEALSTIGSGNVLCSIGPINTTYVRVEFTSTLAQTNVGAVTATTSLTAQVSSLSIVETTVGSTARNEIQELAASNVSGGTFTLTYIGQTTAALEFDATAEEVESQFQALSNIGSGQALVTGGQLTETPLRIEYVDTLGNQDVNKASVSVANLNNGGWSEGANAIRYRDVPVPTDTRVVKRQILRSKAGVSPNVVYVDIETSDVSSNRLTSNNTDADMTEAVVLLDSNGVDSNLSRHGEPPNWKRVVASYSNRMFYLVDHAEQSIVDISAVTATGVGSDWPNVFDDRIMHDDTGSAVIAVDADNQTAALTSSDLTAASATSVTVRKKQPDSQRMYHSWVTSVESFPESVHAGEPFRFPRDAGDGEMITGYSFDGRYFVAFEQQTYRHSFSFDPAQAPNGDARSAVAVPRGMVSSQSWAGIDDNVWVMDRQGVYVFGGETVSPVSQQIKTLFDGTGGGDKIHWDHRKYFHASYFAASRTVRFFVCIDGGPYPRHALCCNVDDRAWWIEEYPFLITSSCEGVKSGKRTVFLGSTGRRIFTLDGQRDGMATLQSDTMRGDATSAGVMTIADTAATFSSTLVGQIIRIVRGPGMGNQRIITAVSGTTLTVAQKWSTRPTTDSKYQIGGVAWAVRTGFLQFHQSNRAERNAVEITWTPVTADSNLDYRIYKDFKATGIVQRMTLLPEATDGVETEADSDRYRVDLTKESGTVEQGFDHLRSEGVSGDKYVNVLLDGTTNGEDLRIHSLSLSGAE